MLKNEPIYGYKRRRAKFIESIQEVIDEELIKEEIKNVKNLIEEE